jgi:hypothetical protein
MNDVTVRYWKRENQIDEGTVYFATATNAGHLKAEKDGSAYEISHEEYNNWVPRGMGDVPPTPPVDTLAVANKAKSDAWEMLQGWTHKCSDSVAIQDQIAMLELWKFTLCAWANNSMAERNAVEGAANDN